LFDVGHGFCAYATTPGGSNILFDCGYDHELQFYPHRYFKDRNISMIYNLVLSHFDQDHVDNLAEIRKVVSFSCIMRNNSIPASLIRREKIGSSGITAGMASALEMHEGWTAPAPIANYGGVKVTYFFNSHPTFEDMNNLSVVTFLHYDGCGIVIPGDLECAGWEELLKQASFRECLSETTIFIASHHGRNAGYNEQVFDYCKPHIILLSDKNLIYGSQEHDYAKHSSGIKWDSGQTRKVLTTRSDGHMRINKEAGKPALVTINVAL
jgi:beta-lactamase superfamily II metal-dependent hydrolase